MPYLFGRLEGRNGRIEVPTLGARLGEITNWTLVRRASEGPESEFYRLTATCRFVNAALYKDPDYEKRVVIQLGKSKQYRVEIIDEAGVSLRGSILLMEKVKIWPLETAR